MKKARFRRRSWALLTAGLLTLAVGVTAGGVASAQSKSLTVGSKDFSGAQAISQAYGQALENKGYDISFKDNLGATEIVYKALENGDLDGYADYQGTLLTYLGGTPTGDSAETYKALTAKLAGTDITVSKPAPAVDVNGFYVTKDTAKKYKLKKVSDLTKQSSKLTFGGPPECEERPLCLGDTSQQLYGLEFSEVKKLDAGGPITVQALEDGDIDVAPPLHRQQRDPEGRGVAQGRQGPAARRQPGLRHQPGQGHEGDHERPQRGLGEVEHRGVQQDVARHQREQGRPVRRGGRLPEEERSGIGTPSPSLAPCALGRAAASDGDQVFSRLAITLTVVATITAPNRNEMSACRSTSSAHLASGDVGVGHLERHADREGGVREVDVVGPLVRPSS